ncbi:MAG: SH3 domain-containing protein [Poseidonibacter sp.]|uniref:C40 family peptidase n=1 Tax=Poseidonibacter sp. TaxID=2321188 RepID=UPI00359E9582
MFFLSLKKAINIALISSTLFFTACSVKEPTNLSINDLAKNSVLANDDFIKQDQESKKFLEKHFYPWKQKKVSYSKKEAMWGFSYKNKKIYLENHRKADKSWFDKQIDNSNFDDYNTVLKKAITLKNTNVRVFPTNSVMFYNPIKQGEGFPFDYNQNSLLKINTPIFVSHFSKDKAWAYIQSSTVGGWVLINDIVFVDEKFINEFKTKDYFVSIKEKFPIYDTTFREYVKIATIFPKKYGKYLIASKNYDKTASVIYTDISEKNISSMPFKFNEENRIAIAKSLINEPYGWGGLLNNRDCSSFTQDYFAVFGKFLHRNSRSQTTNGKYVDISNLTNKEKKEFISKNAVPFSTLVYLKGHIMLYIGDKNNEPLVMHNMWSVKLKNIWGAKSRHIVGKASITTLEPGKNLNNFDEENNVLKKIKGIVIL